MEKSKKLRKNYKKEAKEYKEQLQRVQAEFENFVKRNEKDRNILIKYASKDLLLKLVDIFDDFERALNVADRSEKKELIEGLKLIFCNFEKILKEEEVSRMNCLGEKFDPNKHEVLEKVKSEDDEDKIIDELQKGYIFKDKILRFSKVRVSKGKNE